MNIWCISLICMYCMFLWYGWNEMTIPSCLFFAHTCACDDLKHLLCDGGLAGSVVHLLYACIYVCMCHGEESMLVLSLINEWNLGENVCDLLGVVRGRLHGGHAGCQLRSDRLYCKQKPIKNTSKTNWHFLQIYGHYHHSDLYPYNNRYKSYNYYC